MSVERKLTIDEVAEQEGVHPTTVLAWIAGDELTAYSVSKSARSLKARLRISESALAEFVARRTVNRISESVQQPAPVRRRHRNHGDYIKVYEE